MTSRLLNQLYQECAGSLLRFFTRRHGSDETARDLVQETFLRVARNPANVGEAASLKAYVFGIARHLSLSTWRQCREETLSEEELHQVPAAESDPRIRVACEVIASLPGLQREILEMRLLQGLTYKEIADVLRIPVGTVRSRLHHAVEALRTSLSLDEITSPSSP
jgi:RNA polymerase sigma-70 factor (ECF subfamily)